MACQVQEFLPRPPGGDALEGVDQPGDGNGGRKVDQQVDVVRLAVELGRFGPEVPAYVPQDLLRAIQEGCGEHRMPGTWLCRPGGHATMMTRYRSVRMSWFQL